MKIHHVWCFIHGQVDVSYHWHREMEVLFVLRGRFRLVIEGEAHNLAEGDLIVINPDAPHNSISVSEDALICGVHLDLGHFERRGLAGFQARCYECCSPENGTGLPVRAVKAIMAHLAIIEDADSCATPLREALSLLLATTIYRDFPRRTPEAAETPLGPESQHRILRILDRLDTMRSDVSLSAMAKAEGVTVNHLSRLFKRHLGMGFRDYRVNLRLDAAAEELRITRDAVAEIIERNSFGNPAVFYRKFRARFGSTPANYRRDRSTINVLGKLSPAERQDAMSILARHAAGIGQASEQAFSPGSGHPSADDGHRACTSRREGE
ncbi:MAG: helix-turn-helix domain-containing protein [Rhodobacteraceae bacterium]|nr:helix-turn-helix domain-containing protein [Paracoccaceae bacterium]